MPAMSLLACAFDVDVESTSSTWLCDFQGIEFDSQAINQTTTNDIFN